MQLVPLHSAEHSSPCFLNAPPSCVAVCFTVTSDDLQMNLWSWRYIGHSWRKTIPYSKSSSFFLVQVVRFPINLIIHTSTVIGGSRCCPAESVQLDTSDAHGHLLREMSITQCIRALTRMASPTEMASSLDATSENMHVILWPLP